MAEQFEQAPLEETYISSLVVQVKPASVPEVARQIGAAPGTEVPIASAEGKLVVCLETTTLGKVTDTIDTITTMPDVLSCTLVSHHVENTAGLEEPVAMPASETAETTT